MINTINFIKRWQLILFVLVVTIIMHIGILANPGFYSHDEWDKFDHVSERGLMDFIKFYGRVIPGPEFGFPVRPIGFIQQGITSLWLQSAPIIPHAFDVLLHASIAIIVLLALINIGSSNVFGLTSALVFAISPLTTMATAWPAASFDQWYVLFVCLACWIAYKTMSSKLTILSVIGLITTAGCAILSKESAIVLPAAVVLTFCIAYLLKRNEQKFPIDRALFVLFLVIIPLTIYLAIRLPAIWSTISGQSHVAYTPSFKSIGGNLFAYFVFPFLPSAAELRSPVQGGLFEVGLSLLMHTLLIFSIIYYAGIRYVILYILAYVMFIAPVVSLSQPAGHYIYGSAVPQAIAIGFVLVEAARRRHVLTLLVGGSAVLLLTTHMIMIQQKFYKDGVCQSAFFTSLDARLVPHLGSPQRDVIITPEGRARVWVGQRALHDRERFSGQNGHPLVLFANDPRRTTSSDPLFLTMGRDCRIR